MDRVAPISEPTRGSTSSPYRRVPPAEALDPREPYWLVRAVPVLGGYAFMVFVFIPAFLHGRPSHQESLSAAPPARARGAREWPIPSIVDPGALDLPGAQPRRRTPGILPEIDGRRPRPYGQGRGAHPR